MTANHLKPRPRVFPWVVLSPVGCDRRRCRLLLQLLAAAIALLPTGVTGQERLLRDSVVIAYWRVPSENTDRLIIAVHGGPGLTHQYLRPEFDRYSEWGEVVYYDQRGCGGSSAAARFSWRDHVGDLRNLIAALRGNRAVILVGSSFGSSLIHLYAGLYPEEVDGIVSSGLILNGNITPAQLEARLTRCPGAARATSEGMADAPWWDVEIWKVPRLVLEDSGPGGLVDERPIQNSSRHFSMRMPSHDPWFTHPSLYFVAVEAFFSSIPSGD